jgi:hypothetical protein
MNIFNTTGRGAIPPTPPATSQLVSILEKLFARLNYLKSWKRYGRKENRRHVVKIFQTSGQKSPSFHWGGNPRK